LAAAELKYHGADEPPQIGYDGGRATAWLVVRSADQPQIRPRERSMKQPDSNDTAAPLGSPFDFNLTNIVWLAGAFAVILALVVLKMTGVIH
jgi:hypothetical protein